jgi:hypothetical protein
MWCGFCWRYSSAKFHKSLFNASYFIGEEGNKQTHGIIKSHVPIYSYK